MNSLSSWQNVFSELEWVLAREAVRGLRLLLPLLFIRRHVYHSSHSGAHSSLQTETLVHRATAGTCDSAGLVLCFWERGQGRCRELVGWWWRVLRSGSRREEQSRSMTEGSPVGEILKTVLRVSPVMVHFCSLHLTLKGVEPGAGPCWEPVFVEGDGTVR